MKYAFLICAAVLIAAPIGCATRGALQSEEAVAAAPADEFAPFVQVLPVVEQPGVELPRSYTGVVRATRTSELGFKRTGRVEKILVQHGEVVKQGQTLAELDTASLQAELAVLNAERLVAEARLKELVAGPRKQTLDAARAQVAELEAQREQLRITHERSKRLVGSEIISQQTADDARLTFAAIEKRLAAQQHVLAELEEGTRAEQIEAAKAQIAQLDASRDRLKLEITESTLTAPFDAVISRRLVDEGAIVAPGLSLLRIVENAEPEAWIGIPPETAAALTADERYQLHIDGRDYLGRLKSVLPELDSATRTRTAVFTVTADGGASRLSFGLGQIVQLQRTQEVRQPGYWLPLQALTRGARGLWSAFVIDEPTSESSAAPTYALRRSDVEILQVDSDRVLVRGTLNAGERVVASGVQKLTAGQRVRIADDSAATADAAEL